MDNKEYIQIPKEDFIEIYARIKNMIVSIQEYYRDLKGAYEILSRVNNDLERMINKDIMEDLNIVKEKMYYTKNLLEFLYFNLDGYIKKVLEKAKKEQIDKKENE